jgi:hypothetical protein
MSMFTELFAKMFCVNCLFLSFSTVSTYCNNNGHSRAEIEYERCEEMENFRDRIKELNTA